MAGSKLQALYNTENKPGPSGARTAKQTPSHQHKYDYVALPPSHPHPLQHEFLPPPQHPHLPLLPPAPPRRLQSPLPRLVPPPLLLSLLIPLPPPYSPLFPPLLTLLPPPLPPSPQETSTLTNRPTPPSVTSYATLTGHLHLHHAYPPPTAGDRSGREVTAVVDLELLGATVRSTDTQVGAWVNVIGTVEETTTSRSRGKGEKSKGKGKRQEVRIQAVMLWSAGGIKLDEYEKAVEGRKASEAPTTRLKT